MKLGFAGAGMIAKAVLKDLAAAGGYEINAICATPSSVEKLRTMCLEYSIPAYYTDYDRMLAESDTDTVYVAVPNHMHYEFCRKALEAGRHVICEKPFTSNYREAVLLHELAAAKNLIIVEAVSTRYLPNVLKIRDDIGKIGNIKIVTMNYSQYSSRYDAFKSGNIMPAFDPLMSGGALMDLNIYNINFAIMLFGEPLSLDYRANIERGIDTSGILTMDYGSFKCAAIAAKDCKAPISALIQGDEGCIMIDSSLNLAKSYCIMMNKNDGSKQMSAEGGERYDYNGGLSRIEYEFRAFRTMVDSLDYEEAQRMMRLTLITMKIQTKARLKAGVVFPADKILQESQGSTDLIHSHAV